jgi:hypothetical protein
MGVGHGASRLIQRGLRRNALNFGLHQFGDFHDGLGESDGLKLPSVG